MCVKHVPDIQAVRELRSDGRLVRDGGDGTVNEVDENALEAAAQIAEHLRSQGQEAEVIVVTMGPDDAEDAARRGLQLGADWAMHVCDDAIAGSDAPTTAAVLAAAVRSVADDGPVDLVLTGMASLDGLTSLLPVMLADVLNLPALTRVSRIEVADGTITVSRDLDRVTEVLTAGLPALVSVTDRANEPRYPNFQAIMAARKKPVRTVSLADLGITAASVGAEGARTAVVTAVPRPPRADRILVTGGAQAGRELAAYLVDHGLVRAVGPTGTESAE